MKVRSQKWDVDNPEKRKAISKKCYDNNTEKRKAYYAEHKEEIKATNKKWNDEHPEQMKIYSKKYRDKYGSYNNAKRRATKINQTPPDADMEKIKEIYKNCPKGYEVDHIHPLSKGGLHHQDNLQYLTMSENRSKGAKILYERLY
jgi:5-methylcytosine-specific restriction endonuclease McrA